MIHQEEGNQRGKQNYNCFEKHFLFKEGASLIQKTQNQREELSLENMLPIPETPTLDQSAEKFQNIMDRRGKAVIKSWDLWVCMVSTNSREAIISLVVYIFANLIKVYFAIMYLIMFDFFQAQNIQVTLLIGLMISLGLAVNVFLIGNGYGYVQVLVAKMKASLFYVLYRHILKLNPALLRAQIQGQIINAITQFHNLLDDNAVPFMKAITSPLPIIGISILFVYRLGWASLIGVATSILFEVIHFYYAIYNQRYLTTVAALKDARMYTLTEIVFSLKYIKMQMWQWMFLRKAKKIRAEEMTANLKYGAGFALENTLGEGVTLAAILLTLGAITAYSNITLTSQKTLQAVLLLMILRKILYYVSLAISYFFQINVLLDRVASILNLSNFKNSEKYQPIKRQEWASYSPKKKDSSDYILEVKSISYSYKTDSQQIIRKTNLKVKEGDMVTILGRVGSGKTTLLDIIANQIAPTSGEIASAYDDVCYVEQEPAIFSGTVRQNIILAQPFNPTLYQQVIEYCCLKEDMTQFEQGDKTFISIKSSNISGGQKSRIVLARAIYSRKHIMILDDPLSALDIRVGQKICSNLHRLCAQKQRTIIMTLNSTYYLRDVDKIMVMDCKKLTKITRTEALQFLAKQHEESQMISEFSRLSSVMVRFQDNYNDEPLSEPSLQSEPSNRKAQSAFYQTGQISELHPVPICSFSFNFLKKLFRYFFVSKANYFLFPFTILLYIISEGLSSFAIFLFNRYNRVILNGTPQHQLFKRFGNIFILITILVFIFKWMRIFFLGLCIQMANKQLYKAASEALLFSSLKGFSKEGSGQTLDKFSQDLGMLDTSVIGILNYQLIMTFQCGSQMVMISLLNPKLIPFLLIMTLSNYFINNYCSFTILAFRNISLDLKGGPVLTRISQTIKCIKSVGVYKLDEIMKNKMVKCLRDSMKATISYFKAVVTFVAFTQASFWIPETFMILVAISMINYQTVGIFCVVIISMVDLFQFFHWLSGNSLFVTAILASMDRIQHFITIKNAHRERLQSASTSYQQSQPSSGSGSEYSVEVKNFSLRYNPYSDLTLNKVSLSIREGKKVAIIGRTGSGKSSFIQALYRLAEPESDSVYRLFNRDGMRMSLKELRGYFSCIPQFPFVFQSTIRKNVDPFDDFSDKQVKGALKNVEMLASVQKCPNGIEASIQKNQIELSYGERQLLCLARVLLKKNKILIMDEATSNIDEKTDAIIQSIIRRKLKGTTIISVAHKLKTILDYDEILVLQKGVVIERGTSPQLLRQKGIFYEMMSETDELKRLREDSIANSSRISNMNK